MEAQNDTETAQQVPAQEVLLAVPETKEEKTVETSLPLTMVIDTPSLAPMAAPETTKSETESTPPTAVSETNNLEPTPCPCPVDAAASPADSSNPKRQPRAEPPEGMSRNAYKKLLRQQKWDAEHDKRVALRKEKIAKEKERKRLRREQEEREKAEKAKQSAGEGSVTVKTEQEGEKVSTTQDGEAATSTEVTRKAKNKKKPMKNITFLLDCSFDDKMLQKEINSLASQIIRIYSENRKAVHPVQLMLTSYGGRLEEKFDVQLNGQRKGWKHFTFTSDPYPVNENTVYLTTEGTESLTTLEPNTTYVIGGIVDRNRYKGLCYEKAASQGLRTARLPIDDYIKMSSRKVLTCNHVVEIMLKYLECKDWKTAFHQIIPERKLHEETKLTRKQKRAAALERKRRAEAGEDVGEEGDEHYDSHEDYSDHEDEEAEKEPKIENAAAPDTPITETLENAKTPEGESSSKRKSDEVVEDDSTVSKRVKAEAESATTELATEGTDAVIPNQQ
ncbi:hypothetical protein BJ508DRAFT_144019 [Ascobolus immersus RN42]|uniref:tRNA (guanine(9)-N1)-methyltransferase n=1 Tax=Ascobolus immersus RN42 TaxID=1160509 RepID=A0A3N4I114_ASCIM|nr:hypothetical protein BJ508DRAFT_144019 [Ascobolus immersus RN42]